MASNVTAARCFDFTVDHHAGTVKAFHNRGGSGLKDVFLWGGYHENLVTLTRVSARCLPVCAVLP